MRLLREGKELSATGSFGWVDQTSESPEYAYFNIMPEEDLQILNDLAYTNENGEFVVNYDDLSDSEVTDCTMARSVVGEFPSGVRTGKPAKVVLQLSEDDDGVEWLNIVEILELKEADAEAEMSEFSPESVQTAEAPEA
jgi:hypothetical protein